MRLRGVIRAEGPGPDERIISLPSNHEVVVSSRSLRLDPFPTIGVSEPLQFRDNEALVELPRETSTGARRIWVPTQDLIEDEDAGGDETRSEPVRGVATDPVCGGPSPI